MTIETKVYQRGQTTIPSKFRKKYNIKPNDIVEWKEDETGEIKVNFRKKVTIEEMMGSVKLDHKIDPVKIVRSIYHD